MSYFLEDDVPPFQSSLGLLNRCSFDLNFLTCFEINVKHFGSLRGTGNMLVVCLCLENGLTVRRKWVETKSWDKNKTFLQLCHEQGVKFLKWKWKGTVRACQKGWNISSGCWSMPREETKDESESHESTILWLQVPKFTSWPIWHFSLRLLWLTPTRPKFFTAQFLSFSFK